MNRKKWTIGLLGLASILSLIAIACGRRNDSRAEDNGIGNTANKPQAVYISESTIFCENGSLINCAIHNNTIYYILRTWKDNAQGEREREERLYVTDLATMENREISVAMSVGEHIAYMAVSQDDELLLVLCTEEAGKAEEKSWILMVLDPSGQEILQTDITSFLPKGAWNDESWICDMEEDGEGYISVIGGGNSPCFR